jgi:hypothetical protein
MRVAETAVLWAIVSTIGFLVLLGYALSCLADVRRQATLTQACEQRAVDGEKARKQSKDEKECRELARDAEKLLASIGKLDDQEYIAAWQVGYERCMEVRGSKP